MLLVGGVAKDRPRGPVPSRSADRGPVGLQTTLEKLADHHISAEEVRQVSDGDRIVIGNPRPRVEGSVLMIGPTHGGRVLAVVLNPDPVDDGTWHVRTAWPASAAQTNRYRPDR